MESRRMAEPDASQSPLRRPALALVPGTGGVTPARSTAESVALPAVVSFDRRELNLLFNLYGVQVAAGEWRDYALDFMPAKAVFSIFRRTSEMPLYRIEKIPELARRQGAYCVVAANGQILRRGHELARVLRVLDKGMKLVGRE
jgi:hypothetical protein